MAKKGIGEETLEEVEEAEETETKIEAKTESSNKLYKYKVESSKVIFQGKVYTAVNGVVSLPHPNIKGFKRAD